MSAHDYIPRPAIGRPDPADFGAVDYALRRAVTLLRAAAGELRPAGSQLAACAVIADLALGRLARIEAAVKAAGRGETTSDGVATDPPPPCTCHIGKGAKVEIKPAVIDPYPTLHDGSADAPDLPGSLADDLLAAVAAEGRP